jgi:F0F1-type ATP synthase membrane subunit a
MGFFTQKRQIDTVSLVSVIIVTAFLTFFATWLSYSSKVNKMQSSCEMKVQIIKGQVENLQKKNADLQLKLDKVREAMSEENSD